MWSYSAKLLDIRDDGRVTLLLKKQFVFPVDFGFEMKSNIRHEMSSIKMLWLKGLTKEQVTMSSSKIQKAFKNDVTAVTFWSAEKQDWEALIYAGDICINVSIIDSIVD